MIGADTIRSGFWRGKRVLITGHTGFKGGWLCHLLLRLGAQVAGYSLPAPTDPSLFVLTSLEERVDHHHGDVCDLAGLTRCLRTAKPDIVFHMAAQSLVLESYRDPAGTFATNVMGTVNLLEAVRSASSVEACVVVTSDKCYENDESGRAHREDDPLGGIDPYSASKSCAELVTAAFRRSLFQDHAVRVASVRAGNVVGGGDWSDDRLIPDIVRALTKRATLELRRPDAVRPWQHVLEPLGGYLMLAERLCEDDVFEGAWNFGPAPGEIWSVRDVVSTFVDVWGEASATGISIVPLPYAESGFLGLDSSKARAELGWTPRWGVREAISRTVAWYGSFYRDGAEADVLIDADLEAYATANTGPHDAATQLAGDAPFKRPVA